MAIVRCVECGNEVSNKALTCPQCGVTVRKKTSGCAVVTAGFAGLLVLALIIGDYPSPSSPDAAGSQARAASERASTEKGDRARTLVLLIQKTLRNPDSFKAESVIVTDALAVCATYSAQNGFGGMNREQAVMSADQKQVKGQSDSGFDALWNRECAGKTGLEAKYLFPR